LVIVEAETFIRRARAAITSSTVDMPDRIDASPLQPENSAGVS
jgi:hypothetical protein